MSKKVVSDFSRLFISQVTIKVVCCVIVSEIFLSNKSFAVLSEPISSTVFMVIKSEGVIKDERIIYDGISWGENKERCRSYVYGDVTVIGRNNRLCRVIEKINVGKYSKNITDENLVNMGRISPFNYIGTPIYKIEISFMTEGLPSYGGDGELVSDGVPSYGSDGDLMTDGVPSYGIDSDLMTDGISSYGSDQITDGIYTNGSDSGLIKGGLPTYGDDGFQ